MRCAQTASGPAAARTTGSHGAGARRLALAVVAVLTLAAPAVARAAGAPGVAGPMLWAAPVALDPGSIDGLACPSPTLCVAVDDTGHLLSTRDPSAGAGAWRTADVAGTTPLTAVSCPSQLLCVAVDATGDVVSSTDPGSPHPVWRLAHVDSSLTEPSPFGGGPDLLQGVACPTTSLCVAVDSVGNAVYSLDPAGGAGAWSVAHIDYATDPHCVGTGLTCQSALTGVACPAATSCTAVDFAGNILQTTAPASGAPWPSRPASASPAPLWGLSCPSVSRCVAVDGEGGELIGWNPVLGTPAIAARMPAPAFGIWCEPGGICLASAQGDNGAAQLLASADPLASVPRFTVTAFGAFTGFSCPLASWCLGADNQGEVVAGATVSSIVAALDRQLSSARLPGVGALLRQGGCTLRLTSPLAGRLQLDWESRRATRWGGGPTVLAGAVVQLVPSRTSRITLKLTPPGRALLAGADRLSVSAAATFTANSGTVTSRRRITLTPQG